MLELDLSSVVNKQGFTYFVEIYAAGISISTDEKKKTKFEPGRNTKCFVLYKYYMLLL